MLDKIKGCLFYKRNEIKEIKKSIVEMKESIKKIQDVVMLEDSNKDEDNDVDQEVQEKIKYCQYLISTFKPKKDNKGFLKCSSIVGIILLLMFSYILYCASTSAVLSDDVKDFAINIISVIEIPLGMFILTDSISSVRNTKIENENRINEFIKSAMPLFTAGFLNDEEYINIKNYYLHFTNLNDDECKNLISKEERPDVFKRKYFK